MDDNLIVFGKYYKKSNLLLDITWRVIDREGDKALLITDKAIIKETHELYGYSWERCDLRDYLNDVFLDYAFTEEEKEYILSPKEINDITESNSRRTGGKNNRDKVFILSETEVKKYFPSETDRIAYDSNGFQCNWLTRTLDGIDNLVYVSTEGTFESVSFASTRIFATRPAVWVNYENISKQTDNADNDGASNIAESLPSAFDFLREYDCRSDAYKEALSILKSGIKLKNSKEECPKTIMAILVAEFIKTWHANEYAKQGNMSVVSMLNKPQEIISMPSVCDRIIDELDRESFMLFMLKAVEGINYRFFIIPLCIYADEEVASWLSSEIMNCRKVKAAKKRYKAENCENALLLSNTEAAAKHFEQRRKRKEYDALRESNI